MMKTELDRYISAPLPETSINPYKWWTEHKHLYPHVATLARNKMSIPATSLPSERLFSKAGTVISDRKTRLKPENTEKLIFLSKNIRSMSNKKEN